MKTQLAIVKKLSTPAPRNSRKPIFRREYLELFLSSELAIDVKDNSKKMYRSAINRFFQFCDNNSIELATINRGALLEFKKHLKLSGKKTTTIQNYISTLKIFFDWCAARRLYPNISHRIKSETPSRAFKKKPLTVDESRKLLESIDTSTIAGKRDLAMISLMLICGLRTIEVSRANIGSIERDSNGVYLHVQGKGRNDDSDLVAIPIEVDSIITEYLNERESYSESDPLFVSTSNRSLGKRLSTVTISAVAKKALTRAGITGDMYTAHSLRHSAATNARLNGASLEEVSKLLRHKSLNTTMIYDHTINAKTNPSAKIVADAIFHSPETPDAHESSADPRTKKNSRSAAQRNKKSSRNNQLSTSAIQSMIRNAIRDELNSRRAYQFD